jgi:bacterial/archaeal transporter family-2 protein
MKALFISLSVLAGAVLPFQGAINGKLGNSMQSPVYASFISFLVGTVGLLIYGVIGHGPMRIQAIKDVPWYEFSGGILGAFYVLVVILMLPRLGAALTFSLIVAGQMVISLVLDHTGFLVAAQHPINMWRVIGLGFIICGVVLVRKF